MNNNRFKFKRWQRKMFKPGSVAVIIAKKAAGKSTVLADICHSIRDCPEVTLFQKTYDSNNLFHGVVPPLFCYTTWDREKVKAIIERQRKRNGQRMKDGRPPVYHTIIVDDLACSQEFTKDPQLEELIMNARWLKINILITLQDSLKLHPAIRNNTDWCFFLKDIMPNSRKRLYEQYTGQFPTQKQFEKVFERMTENRGVMVLNNTSLSNEISNNYFFWRATLRNFNDDPKIPRWRMGSKAYWAFNYRYYKEEEESEDFGESDNEHEMIIFK